MQFKQVIFAGLAASANAQSLSQVLASTPDLSSLAGLITAAGAEGLLGAVTNVTLFAPSNSAISALTSSGAATNDSKALQSLLSYHAVKGAYLASAVPENVAYLPTYLEDPAYANVTGGQRLGVKRTGSSVTLFSGALQNSSVTTANLNFTGGVVHVIDKVLTLPQSASKTLVAAGLSSLAGALTNASLVSTVDGLGNVTIFAPNNAAFQRIGSALPTLNASTLSSILTYHVIQGSAPLYSTSLTSGAQVRTLQGGQITVTITPEGVFANGAKVVIPNVLIAGGVVHVIDNVLNPSNTTAGGSSSTGSPAFSGASSVSSAPFTSGIATPSSTIGTATSRAGAAQAMITGAVGAAALFGAGAIGLNL